MIGNQDPMAGNIDVAVLAPGARREDVQRACRDALRFGCASVCVAPVWVAEAAAELAGSPVAVGAVIGFPLGAATTLTKVFESLECIKHGAIELDVVVHLGAARSGDFKSVREEAKELMKRTSEATHKFILEMSILTDDELRRTVKALVAAGPAFVKTGTGTVGEAVRPEDVARLRKITPRGIAIKAAGGIRTRQHAEALLEAGATRIGTSTPATVLTP